MNSWGDRSVRRQCLLGVFGIQVMEEWKNLMWGMRSSPPHENAFFIARSAGRSYSRMRHGILLQSSTSTSAAIFRTTMITTITITTTPTMVTMVMRDDVLSDENRSMHTFHPLQNNLVCAFNSSSVVGFSSVVGLSPKMYFTNAASSAKDYRVLGSIFKAEVQVPTVPTEGKQDRSRTIVRRSIILT
jgi:hypothetical protein